MKRRLVLVVLLVGLSLMVRVVRVSGRAGTLVTADAPHKAVQGTLAQQNLSMSVSGLVPASPFVVRPGGIPVASRTRKFDPRDVELLARVIHAEARGEPFIGQVAVGAVIINRLHHPRFPSTLQGVVFQAGALCTVRDGQINLRPDHKAREAAMLALAGVDPTMGSLYFYNPESATSRWIRKRPIQKQIGHHRFAR